MCGISGLTGHISPGLAARMAHAQAHRGPDGSGVFEDVAAGIALSHVRLAILDTSPAAAQPMHTADGRFVLAYNGELYNFRALRRELEGHGHVARSDGDTEVLLYALARFGPALLPRLEGIFAFALWDRQRRELLLARDGLGVKPLYTAQLPDAFLFASELKGLLACPAVERELDPQALRHYLTYLWCPAPRTPLRAVRKVEPGEALLVRDGRVARRWAFYTPPVRLRPALTSAAQAIDAVARTVRAAVRRQMVADAPLGAFLSGGLDSSAVVAFAREAAPDRPLHCFTMALDPAQMRREGAVADLPYARQVARHLGVELHEVPAGAWLADELPAMLYHLDEPQADPAPLNVLLIARLARRHGVKVLLSGAGGDDLFAGYRRHRALLLERWWAWLPPSARAALARLGRALPARPTALRRVGKALRYADRSGDERLASYFYWLDPAALDRLLTPDLRAAGQCAEPLVATLARLPADTTPLQRMLHLECRHFLADHNLNYTDKMGMAAGVEVRVPLLDPQVVELAARLPDRFRQRGGTGKWVLRQALAGVLPREVIERPKSGFGAPLRAWLHGPLRELVGDTLSPPSLARRGWFEPAAVQALIAADRAGRSDAAYPIFAVLCVELWARALLRGEGSGC